MCLYLLGFDGGDDPREFVLDVIHNVTGVRGIRTLCLLVILGEDLELVGAELEHFPNVEDTLSVLLLPLLLHLQFFFQDLLLLLENQINVICIYSG